LNDLDKLYAKIEKTVMSALQKEVGLALKQTINDYFHEKFYDYEPRRYERSGQLIKSLTLTKVEKTPTGYAITVFFDTSKIQPNREKGQYVENRRKVYLGQTVYKGEVVTDRVPLWAELGLIDPKDRGEFNGGFVRATMNEYKNTLKHVNQIGEKLKKLGFNIEIK
jgi:hypothetical protein